MLLSQITTGNGGRAVVVRNGTEAHQIEGIDTTRDLALAAIEAGQGLAQFIQSRRPGPAVDLPAALAEGRVLPPLDHPDPAHMLVTGTGLTHLGSAIARDAMHGSGEGTGVEETDSLRMFRMGVEGGRPAAGTVGVQPEWFFKGSGDILVRPGGTLTAPDFAEDGGEEPEIAGLYVIAADGTPVRLGFALANEFSDHAMERRNYLYLAHSKLRQASLGPEMLVGALPRDIRGTSRIDRDGLAIFDQPFLSGEENMTHSIANLEHHHFKYDGFRRPGDVHIHMFGAGTLSCAAGIACQSGDIFRIEAQGFGLPLTNALRMGDPGRVTQVQVRAL